VEDLVPAGQEIEYADDIAAMVKADRKNPPPKGQLLFFGSSIIREWAHLPDQFAPIPVLNRGFGGARTWETLHYANDIVLPYEPKMIVYYAGSNDINVGETPEAILERYRHFSGRVTERLPDTMVYFLAIFRAPQKKDRWEVVDAANRLIRDYSLKTKNRGFLDANPMVFDSKGQPREALYQEDGLHFTDAAYHELAAFLKPILQGAWEKQSSARQE
jgi:lysophospholipase L1-like esterase